MHNALSSTLAVGRAEIWLPEVRALGRASSSNGSRPSQAEWKHGERGWRGSEACAGESHFVLVVTL